MADDWTLATRYRGLLRDIGEACEGLSAEEALLLRRMLLLSLAEDIEDAEQVQRDAWDQLTEGQDD